MLKPGNGSIEDYVEKRFQSTRARRAPTQRRKVPKALLFVINAVLIAFMIFLVRSKDTGPVYHTSMLQNAGITYRFSLGRSKGAPYYAALSLKAGNEPLYFTKSLALLTIHHGDTKLLEQTIESPSGLMVIAPGEEKTVAIRLHNGEIDAYLAANPEIIPKVVRVPFIPTIITVPLTAKISVFVPEKKEFSLKFKYEVKQ